MPKETQPSEPKECIYPGMKLYSCPFMELGRICPLTPSNKCPAEIENETPTLPEEQVAIRAIEAYITCYPLNSRNKVAVQIHSALKKLGYFSPSEVKEAEKKAAERVLKRVDDLIIGTTAPFEKRMTEGCIILDANLPQWEALKSKVLEE